MKKIFKPIRNLLILIIIINVICFVLDRTIFLVKIEPNETEIVRLENEMINDSSSKKLTVKSFDRKHEDYIILAPGETIPPKGNKKRILIIGDSFVWPYSNRNINTMFWRRLQYFLEKEGYNDVEVYAAGSAGMGTVDEVNLILKNEATMKKVEPDLIIFGVVLNDFQISNFKDPDILFTFNRDRFVKDHYDNFLFRLVNKLYPNLYNRVLDVLVDSKINDEAFNEKYGQEYGYGENYLYVKYASDFYINKFEKEGIKEIKEQPVPIFMFELSSQIFNDVEKEFLEKAANISKKNGVPYYSLRDKFNSLSEKYGVDNLRQNSDDSHPSEILGNMYAEELLKILKNDYSDYLGEKGEVKKFKFELNDSMPYESALTKINEYQYTFVWNKEPVLKYPLDTSYLKFNLKYPTKLKKFTLNSDNIKSAKVWINVYNDDKNFIEVESKNGEFVYPLDNFNNVYSINIHLELKDVNDNSPILMKFSE